MRSDGFDDLASGPGFLPFDLDSMVRSELSAGEKLVWTGQPLPRRLAMAALPVSIFGVFFGGFAAFWIGMALWMTHGAGNAGPAPPEMGWLKWLFPLFGLPFLFVGLCLLFSPFWVARLASKTVYALTDRRVITWTPGWSAVKVRSFPPAELRSMTRVQRSDGSGDLIFAERSSYDAGNQSRTVTRIGLFAIPSVHEVETLIRSTLLHD